MADGIIPLSVDFVAAPGTQTTALVERGLSATGPWTPITTLELLVQIGIGADTTAPFDMPVWYRFTGNPGEQIIIQGPFTEEGDGTVWIKDPLRPWANLNLMFCSSPQQAMAAACAQGGPDIIWAGFSEDFVRRADASLFDVFNDELSADHYGRRKRLDGGLSIFTKTIAARDAVEALFTAGGPLQLQLPAEYGWPDAILQPLDLVEAYSSRDQRRPYRLWNVPFRLVRLPFGPIQGTACANWCQVAETWPTYADMTASGATWQEIAQGTPMCDGDVPVDALTDTFTRVVADGWGNADTGQPWTVTQGAAADFSVDGAVGLHTHPALGTFHTTTVPWTAADVNIRIDTSLNVVPAGDGADTHVIARVASTNTFYSTRLFVAPGGAMSLSLRKRIAGVESQLATFATGLTYVANTVYRIRFVIQGQNLMARIWLALAAESSAWQVSAVDADLAGPDDVGVRTFARAGMTNPLPIIFSFDNLSVSL